MKFKSIIQFVKSNRYSYTFALYLKYHLLHRFILSKRRGNIMMLHMGRTGSTVLADLLSQHYSIHWDGEVFIENKKYLSFFNKDPIRFLKYKMSQFSSLYYGFEVKGFVFQDLERNVRLALDDFLREIEKLKFKHYIFLVRKNYLRQYISVLQVRACGNLRTSNKQTKPNKIKINLNPVFNNNVKLTLVEYFNRLDQSFLEISNLIGKRHVLKLVYEEDIQQDPLLAYGKICDFLHLDDENPTLNFKRTNPFKIKDMVENYDELYSALINTQYKWMLEEE